MFFPIMCGASCSFDEILAVSGNGVFTFAYAYPYLYVTDEGAASDSILKIYDIANAASPTLLSTTALPLGSGAREPRIVGNTLYIPYRVSRFLALWNVTNRSAPVLLGSVAVTYDPYCVAVIGTIAAVGFGADFTKTHYTEKIDCSNPAAPVVVDTAGGSSLATAIQATATHFVVAGQATSGGQTYIAMIVASTFNQSDSSVDGLGTAGIGVDMVISSDGTRAYSTNSGNVIINSWDTSDPTNILLLDQAGYGGNTSSQILCLIDDTDRLYVGSMGAGGFIRIMNVSDPSNMFHVGDISTSAETVSDMVNTDGCPGFVWGQGTGAAIHLTGTAPTS